MGRQRLPAGAPTRVCDQRSIHTATISPASKGMCFCTFCKPDEHAVEWRFGKRVRDSVLRRHCFRSRPNVDLMSTSCRPHVDLMSTPCRHEVDMAAGRFSFVLRPFGASVTTLLGHAGSVTAAPRRPAKGPGRRSVMEASCQVGVATHQTVEHWGRLFCPR